MSKMLSSMLIGILCMGVVFLIILFLTVGVKMVINSLKPIPKKPIAENTEQLKPQTKKRKPVKSIVINPDDVDRIYVKKSS